MKTRLLALVLACLMVLSVMPVVAFAEDDVCEFGRSDGDHTLVTCPDGEYIKTVKPQCGKRGYDLFKCPGCSEFFADNFVDPDHKAHALELVDKGYDSTCTETGLTAKYVCVNTTTDENGETIPCGYVEGGEVIEKKDHEWQLIGTDVDCESAAQLNYKCANCDATKSEGTKKEHQWGIPEILVKPVLNENGELINGLAKYTCGLCGKTKEVVIIAEHNCTLIHVPAKDATCKEAGNIEYWQCSHANCGKRFATNDATGAVLTDEQVIIPIENGSHKLTHNAATPATCNKDTQAVTPGVVEHWNCELCGKNFADANATTELESVVDNDGHTWAEEPNVVPPTCETFGFTFYGCLICGALKETDRVPPLGHTTWDDATSTNKAEVWTSCQAGGKKTWNCGTCGEAQEEALAPHTLYKAEFAATCTNFAYSFNYCTVCDATNQAPTATHKNVVYDLSVPVLDAEGNYTYDANGEMIRTLYAVIGEVTYGETLDPTNHNWIVRDTNAPTCTTDGDRVWYCPDCRNTFYTEVVPAFHSVPQGEPTNVVAATCITDAYKTYLCQVCGNEYTIVEKGTATGHGEMTFVTTVNSTCSIKGYDLYACPNEGCTHTEKRNEKPVIQYVLGTFYTEIEGDTSYAERDEYKDDFVGYFKDFHPNATLDTANGIHIQGNCDRLGLYRYFCDDCDTYILVAMPGTGLGHVNDEDYLDQVPDGNGGYLLESAAKDPTCTDKGATHAFVCKYCSTFVPATEIPAKGHTLTKVTDVPADKCDIGYWFCSTCEKMFTDAEGKNLVNSFVDHETEIADFRIFTCDEFGYVHHVCKNCNSEYINSYTEAPGHNWVKTEGKDPTCVEGGVKDKWVCNRELPGLNENGFYAYTCGCVHSENNGEEIPATGLHVNAEGRTFTDKCTDTETLRDCVVCKDYIERQHHYADPVIVDPTCIEYGYELYICVDCHEDLVKKIDDGELGKHVLQEDWAAVEGNPNIEWRGCHTEGCDYREERLIAQVEYFMDVENVLGNVGYTDSSLIAVTVKIKADAPLWGVRFDVNYDENLTFVRAENVSDKLDCGFDFHDNGNGVVTMAADASNTNDKEKTNVIIEGKEDLFVLYFRITLPLDADTGLPVVGHEKTESVLTITPVDAINAADEDLKDVYHGDLVDGVYTDSTKIEILPFMNFNLDCCVNMKDLSYMYDLVLAAEGDVDYDVTLDIDQNGVIEAADYVALYRFLVHAWSYEYMTQIGVPAEELA